MTKNYGLYELDTTINKLQHPLHMYEAGLCRSQTLLVRKLQGLIELTSYIMNGATDY
jgi:hypothetical protein